MKDDLFIQCFNTSPIPGVITTAADGVIVEVNDAFVQMSGYRREDLVGRRTLETGLWVDPADKDKGLPFDGRIAGRIDLALLPKVI
ncbi:MAG TPA: PAS domain S-box protein, partial [Deltaproteobacteria bacterium]|nr:PAS domain S-box protein [Deltaproteobacteria bacterium]